MSQRVSCLLVITVVAVVSAALPVVERQYVLTASAEPVLEVSTEPSPETSPLPDITFFPLPSPSRPAKETAPSLIPLPRVDQRLEGCVAVEHLQGYVLQHPNHLYRRVLCAQNFCATPNHAILVDGVLTSMKLQCRKEWQCVKSRSWVNNLKISANRRAVISERITVTPYDLRFPKWACWIAQIAEDVWNLLFKSTLLGIFIATVSMLSVKAI